jgi:hypothetical protein
MVHPRGRAESSGSRHDHDRLGGLVDGIAADVGRIAVSASQRRSTRSSPSPAARRVSRRWR